MLQSQREVLTERVLGALKQAYGLAQKQEGVVDLGFGNHLEAQQQVADLQLPIGAQMDDAARQLAGKLLTHQFPAHPELDPEGTGSRCGPPRSGPSSSTCAGPPRTATGRWRSRPRTAGSWRGSRAAWGSV